MTAIAIRQSGGANIVSIPNEIRSCIARGNVNKGLSSNPSNDVFRLRRKEDQAYRKSLRAYYR